MSVLGIVLTVVAVLYVLGRRMVGEIVEAKAMLVLPIVLSVVGLLQLRTIDPTIAVVAFTGLGVVTSVAIGLVRGRTVHLGDRDGVLWMRYRVRTVALWVLNFAVKGALFPLELAVSPAAAHAAGRTLMFSIGLGILAETLIVLLRAMRTESTIIWTKGKRGAAHRTSADFDRIREVVRKTDLTALLRRGRDW